MKILISGNPSYGLGQALKEQFPGADFASRSNGHDLSTSQAQDEFARQSLKYDVYISCSALHRFHQTLLVGAVANTWLERKHTGRMIVLGSTADTPVKGMLWMYPIEKKALRALCRNIGMLCLGGPDSPPSGFYITYLSVGYLDTPKTEEKHPGKKKISVKLIASTIEWLLQQPPSVNIHEMAVDPVQTLD